AARQDAQLGGIGIELDEATLMTWNVQGVQSDAILLYPEILIQDNDATRAIQLDVPRQQPPAPRLDGNNRIRLCLECEGNTELAAPCANVDDPARRLGR